MFVSTVYLRLGVSKGLKGLGCLGPLIGFGYFYFVNLLVELIEAGYCLHVSAIFVVNKGFIYFLLVRNFIATEHGFDVETIN